MPGKGREDPAREEHMNHGWLTGLVLVVVLAVFSPAWAQAAEHPSAEGAKPEKHEEKKDDKKDDFFKGMIELTVWTVFVFLVLVFLLGKFAWPMMLEGLEKRERAVTSALEQAQAAQAEAERIKEELDRRYRQANDEIRALMEQSRLRAQQNAEGLLNKARADIQADRDRLNGEIETRAGQTLRELWGRVASLAATISAKVIGRPLPEEEHRRLVDEIT